MIVTSHENTLYMRNKAVPYIAAQTESYSFSADGSSGTAVSDNRSNKIIVILYTIAFINPITEVTGLTHDFHVT